MSASETVDTLPLVQLGERVRVRARMWKLVASTGSSKADKTPKTGIADGALQGRSIDTTASLILVDMSAN